MKEKIINFLSNKKIAILGFGKEGQSTYNFIKNNIPNYDITIIDQNPIENINEKTITGPDYLNNLDQYDIILKTPGINIKVIDTTNIENKIYSQLELLLITNNKNVIGITGTKGKSTTTTLIYNILKEQLDNVLLAGNIGIPILDQIEEADDNTLFVVEMSSHQLEYINKSPHIGIILNLYEDHLDHAGSVEHYHACKLNMFKYQTNNDIAIYCSDNETLNNKIQKLNPNSIQYKVTKQYDENAISLKENKVYYNNEVLYIDDNQRHILGDNNLENIMVAIFIAKLYNLDLKKAKKTIDEFTGLEDRLEYCGTYNNIKYYCDTIATIPEATISGIEALKDVNTLIIGGLDRGINYNEFIKFLNNSKIKNIICMPTTGHKIAEQLNTNKNILKTDTLENAVELAKKHTEPNTICLLSPAAASYEYFKNYIEKGNKFKELIKK